MRHHTIILVPHARARFRKLRVTSRQLVVGASLLAFLTVASIFTTWSFFTNSIDRQELERVRTENAALEEINRSFEGSIRALEKQLGDYEQRTRQLAIVAGVEALTAGAGIGGRALDGSLDGDLESLAGRSTRLASALDRVGLTLEERNRWIASTPAVAPVRGVLTSGYGYRADPITGRRDFHEGVDIATAPGRPVTAPADGIVVKAERVPGLGNAVYLSHGYGLMTRYGHLSKIEVEAGQTVRQGDLLGRVGSTGRATGYHLHYEVRRDGRAVDPAAFILDRS